MLKKGLSLEESWNKCLEMWKWIAEAELGNPGKYHVESYKEMWLQENFGGRTPTANCFFCDYTDHRHDDCCLTCPAVLIDPLFDCDDDLYSYLIKPVAFYNKLVELNEIRLRRK